MAAPSPGYSIPLRVEGRRLTIKRNTASVAGALAHAVRNARVTDVHNPTTPLTEGASRS